MSIRTYVVTGVPVGAQAQAREAGVSRRRRVALEDGVDRTMGHRVRGQQVSVFTDRGQAEEHQAALEAQGLAVTLRRWKIR